MIRRLFPSVTTHSSLLVFAGGEVRAKLVVATLGHNTEVSKGKAKTYMDVDLGMGAAMAKLHEK